MLFRSVDSSRPGSAVLDPKKFPSSPFPTAYGEPARSTSEDYTVSITETTEHGKEEEDDTTETLTHLQSMLGASSLQQSEENMM